MSSRGQEAWTVAGEERRLSPAQIATFEVSEADAEAFIQVEIKDAVERLMPVLFDLLMSVGTQPDPVEVKALLAGVEQTIAAVTYGDQAAIARFRERATRVADILVERGRPETADVVRRLPDTLLELLGRG